MSRFQLVVPVLQSVFNTLVRSKVHEGLKQRVPTARLLGDKLQQHMSPQHEARVARRSNPPLIVFRNAVGFIMRSQIKGAVPARNFNSDLGSSATYMRCSVIPVHVLPSHRIEAGFGADGIFQRFDDRNVAHAVWFEDDHAPVPNGGIGPITRKATPATRLQTPQLPRLALLSPERP